MALDQVRDIVQGVPGLSAETQLFVREVSD
jgi:hypothetical protein